MSRMLSTAVEQKISEAIAGGLYPTREAMLEAGVWQLLNDPTPYVPDDHLPLVEAAIESSNAGHSAEMTRQDWDHLHRLVTQTHPESA